MIKYPLYCLLNMSIFIVVKLKLSYFKINQLFNKKIYKNFGRVYFFGGGGGSIRGGLLNFAEPKWGFYSRGVYSRGVN